MVGPLSDEELRVGGLDRIAAFVRNERSKESVRKSRQRKKQADGGKRQMNIVVPDEERARTTMRSAASVIGDEVAHRAVEAILADESLRPLVAKIADRPALREIVELSERSTDVLEMARLVADQPDMMPLLRRVAATSRLRRLIDLALGNPGFVVLGQKLATSTDLCVGVARILLHIRRRQEKGPSAHEFRG